MASWLLPCLLFSSQCICSLYNAYYQSAAPRYQKFSKQKSSSYKIIQSSAEYIDPRPHPSAMCLRTPLIHRASEVGISVQGGVKCCCAIIRGNISKYAPPQPCFSNRRWYGTARHMSTAAWQRCKARSSGILKLCSRET